MEDNALCVTRCAFGGCFIMGQLNVLLLRGPMRDDIIQPRVEDFFDAIFKKEKEIILCGKDTKLKNFFVIGWAGGVTVLKIILNANGPSDMLEVVKDECSRLAYSLARKLDLTAPFDPSRTLRFAF